jgi:hypothetical protein
MGIERLGDDAHVADARLLYCVHHCSERPEWYVLVGADEDGLMLRVPYLLTQLCSNLINVNGIVAQINTLLLVDADNQALFRDLFYAASLWDVDLDAGLQHRRCHHEDDEQNENHVDQRGDVDVGKRRLRASIGCGERHYRFAPGPSAAL